MATIELDSENVTVRLHGWNPLLALRKTVTVPLRHVRGARARPKETDFESWLVDGEPGTGLLFRGELAVGSIELTDGRSFFDVHDPSRPERVVAIDLVDGEFVHVVVDLDDETPEVVAKRINDAVALRAPSTAQTEA